MITSRNSPFHYLAVEGRDWNLGKDGHPTERTPGEEGSSSTRTREDETERRSEWATDVLGAGCGVRTG